LVTAYSITGWPKMAALSRGFYIIFVSLVLQKVATGLINEVAAK